MTLNNQNVAHTYERAKEIGDTLTFPIVVRVAFALGQGHIHVTVFQKREEFTKEAIEERMALSPTGEISITPLEGVAP
jgi:carbamoylphosphate synthase large subunit